MTSIEQQFLEAVDKGDAEADRLAALLHVADKLEQEKLNRSSMVDFACEYAARGLPVFPCEPLGKKPLVTHGFKDATTDIFVILRWWKRWPDANIAMPTGHTFDVYDIDGPEGVQTMWGSRGIGCLADTLDVLAHVSTPSNGGHHLYVPPDGSGNSAKERDGIDYRGLGGYVIVPPSIGANGRRYVWLKELS